MTTSSAPESGRSASGAPLAEIEAVFEHARALAGPMGKGPLERDVAALSKAFTTEKGGRKSGYMNEPWARRGYLGWFAPMNAARIAALVRRLVDEGLLPFTRPVRLADVGSGPLSASVGVAATLDVDRVVAVDRSRRALDDGRALFARVRPDLDARLRTEVKDLRAEPAPLEPAAFDLVVMANVLGELGDARRDERVVRAVLGNAWSALAPGGRLLVVEPGTRVHARGLMALRDRWAAAADVHILSPCPPVARCPLLARPGDWCHQDVDPRLSQATQAFARAAGVGGRLAPLSHLLVARGEEREPASTVRLVGGLMTRGDRARRYACTVDGLVALTARGGALPPEVTAPLRGARLRTVPVGVEREAQ